MKADKRRVVAFGVSHNGQRITNRLFSRSFNKAQREVVRMAGWLGESEMVRVAPGLHKVTFGDRGQVLLTKAKGLRNIKCPSCGDRMHLFDAAQFYGSRYQHLIGQFLYACVRCDTRVGCHKGTLHPKGTPADAALRRARVLTHGLFDELWKGGAMSRNEAYSWLADKMGLQPDDCHIGRFTIEQCREAYRLAESEGITKAGGGK